MLEFLVLPVASSPIPLSVFSVAYAYARQRRIDWLRRSSKYSETPPCLSDPTFRIDLLVQRCITGT